MYMHTCSSFGSARDPLPDFKMSGRSHDFHLDFRDCTLTVDTLLIWIDWFAALSVEIRGYLTSKPTNLFYMQMVGLHVASRTRVYT